MSLKSNFIIEIATAAPYRWTPYRGFTADGRRGLIIGGNYYATANVDVPGIDQLMNPSPFQAEIVIGNADGIADELVFDPANLGAEVTITRLVFADTPWDEHTAPVVSSSEVWFQGTFGRRGFEGPKVRLACDADLGRRGSSPKTSSRSLMTSHTPPDPGSRFSVRIVQRG